MGQTPYAPESSRGDAVCALCAAREEAEDGRRFVIGAAGAICETCVLRVAEIIARRDAREPSPGEPGLGHHT